MKLLKSGKVQIVLLITTLVLGVSAFMWWISGILERAFDGKAEALSPLQPVSSDWSGLIAILAIVAIFVVLMVWLSKGDNGKSDATTRQNEAKTVVINGKKYRLEDKDDEGAKCQ